MNNYLRLLLSSFFLLVSFLVCVQGEPSGNAFSCEGYVQKRIKQNVYVVGKIPELDVDFIYPGMKARAFSKKSGAFLGEVKGISIMEGATGMFPVIVRLSDPKRKLHKGDSLTLDLERLKKSNGNQ